MPSSKPKQAVVLIHGIGEQVPMDTLRGFVEAVWTTDADLRNAWNPADVWSKPDHISDDLELRRLTTAENKEERRTDFFEFYWAHHMKDTRLSHLRAWLRVLLMRSPRRVPPQLRPVWVTVAVLLALTVVAMLVFADHALKPTLIAGGVVGALWLMIKSPLLQTMLAIPGDAARYLHVAPPNIEIRHNIRRAGIELLQKLHDSRDYDRIIVVGHSLGSVIGYDVLTHLWTRFNERHGDESAPRQDCPALTRLETLVAEGPVTPDSYQEAQTALLRELRDQGNPWLVTDFVTLGSPLAHARYLLARNDGQFARKTAEREFPTCPPATEKVKGKQRVSYRPHNIYVPHHGAVFAPTRWTNLYFPCRRTLWGDVVGGPVAPVFGAGVHDVPVETDLRGNLFAHTLYWTLPKKPRDKTPTWIAALRRAVRLLETPTERRAALNAGGQAPTS